jgi:hypothetical protein
VGAIVVSQENPEVAEVKWISHGDLIKLYASAAARALGLSTAEFLSEWEAGRLDNVIETSDHPDVVRWSMLTTVGRSDPSRSR